MFKRLAAVGVCAAALALTPAVAHADTNVKANLDGKVTVEHQPAKECSGLVALLVALGFDVEVLDVDADVDASVKVDA